MSSRPIAVILAALVFGLAAPASAQEEPAKTPTPAVPMAAPTPVADSDSPIPPGPGLLDQIGQCVESGTLHVAIDLRPGSVPAAAGWTVETEGSPQATLTVEAAQGHVRVFRVGVSKGTFLVRGRGLRPKVYVESLSFEDGKGITQASFRGRGIWRPIVGLFRGVALSALRKLEFRTDIPSVLRGDIFVAKAAPAKTAAASKAVPPTPSFLDIVAEVRVSDSQLVAGAGKPLVFGRMVQFVTAKSSSSRALQVAVDSGTYRPGRAGAPAQIRLSGRVDGQVEDGLVAFGGNRTRFSRGTLSGGRFELSTDDSGNTPTRIEAASFALDLQSGEFHLPGGPEVDVEPPSHVAFADLRVEPDGQFSSVVDADLQGRVGRIVHAGTSIAASDIRLKAHRARVVNSRATGDVDIEFQYRVDYPLVLHYPMKQIGERRVTLLFQGPFTSRLHLEEAGSDSGTVSGTYAFKVPWPPVEQAAFEVLRARWSQDVTAMVKKVDFDIEPRRFSPCGEQCFLLDLSVTAEKKNAGKRSLFKQVCEPEGKADLVVDAPSRSFVLKNVRVEPRCQGVVGWLVNFLAPLLKKTYSDMTLFQMPGDLPFTIESVKSGVDWLAISGDVQWAAAPAAGTSGSR